MQERVVYSLKKLIGYDEDLEIKKETEIMRVQKRRITP